MIAGLDREGNLNVIERLPARHAASAMAGGRWSAPRHGHRVSRERSHQERRDEEHIMTTRSFARRAAPARTPQAVWTAIVAAGLVLLPAAARLARAEVVKVEISKRTDIGASGYEKIVGIAHFAIDPKGPRNRPVTDLDKAAVGADGRVTFSADVYVLRPRDQARANGAALVDVVNRGRKMILATFNRAPGSADPDSEAALGDGFLMRQGYTLVFVGWQFDVRRENGAMGIDVPLVRGVTGIVRATFILNDRAAETTVADLAGYRPLDPAGAETTLTVRDGAFGTPSVVARDRWTLAGNKVALKGGFEPGRTYEVAYKAENPPIAGLGLVALRDMTSWLKHHPESVAPVRYAYTFGSSQSGRFLRTFLYQGMNADEKDRPVFDGVIAHIAGAARLSLNERWATPNALSMWTATWAPFSDARERADEGLLDNDRARGHQPKVFYTNSDVEYWGGGRAAALVHTSADGTKDLVLPDNVRAYYFTGTQHSPGRFPSTVSTGQQPDNPVEYRWTQRALLVAMDKWVRDGVAPPASRYPKLADGTLVPATKVAFPTLSGVQSPRQIAGPRDGAKVLPFLVPSVDEDGNDQAGIRVPEVAVPLATYTGWNFRNPSVGGTSELVALMGSSIRFPRTTAERRATNDPRRAIEERYQSKQHYLERIQQSADALVTSGYLLADDRPAVISRAAEMWAVIADGAEGQATSRTPGR
jgi:hypothetical protein